MSVLTTKHEPGVLNCKRDINKLCILKKKNIEHILYSLFFTTNFDQLKLGKLDDFISLSRCPDRYLMFMESSM